MWVEMQVSHPIQALMMWHVPIFVMIPQKMMYNEEKEIKSRNKWSSSQHPLYVSYLGTIFKVDQGFIHHEGCYTSYSLQYALHDEPKCGFYYVVCGHARMIYVKVFV